MQDHWVFTHGKTQMGSNSGFVHLKNKQSTHRSRLSWCIFSFLSSTTSTEKEKKNIKKDKTQVAHKSINANPGLKTQPTPIDKCIS